MMTKHLTCDMEKDCPSPVTMIEEKGYCYCSEHGRARRDWGRRCRKLRPWEVRLLQAGGALPSYRPMPKSKVLTTAGVKP